MRADRIEWWHLTQKIILCFFWPRCVRLIVVILGLNDVWFFIYSILSFLISIFLFCFLFLCSFLIIIFLPLFSPFFSVISACLSVCLFLFFSRSFRFRFRGRIDLLKMGLYNVIGREGWGGLVIIGNRSKIRRVRVEVVLMHKIHVYIYCNTIQMFNQIIFTSEIKTPML